MSDSMTTISNGMKLAGEALLPGASLLMDGNFKSGAVHAIVGVGARAILGPFAAVVVAADSFSRSVADRHLWEYLPKVGSKKAEPTEEKIEIEKAEPAPAPAKVKAKA